MKARRSAYLLGASLFGLLVGCGGKEFDASANGQDGALPNGTRTYAQMNCPEPAVAPDPSCPCSRRACSPPSMSCRRGSGKSTTTSIGPAGGTATLSGTKGEQFRLDVFAGSLSSKVNVKLSELAVPTPEGYEDWSPIYAVEPLDIELVNGGAIQVPWQLPHAGGGVVPRTLATFTSPSLDGPWLPANDSYDNAGFDEATVLSGGYFFVGLPAADPACE